MRSKSFEATGKLTISPDRVGWTDPITYCLVASLLLTFRCPEKDGWWRKRGMGDGSIAGGGMAGVGMGVNSSDQFLLQTRKSVRQVAQIHRTRQLGDNCAMGKKLH